jgi:hypothetical protein
MALTVEELADWIASRFTRPELGHHTGAIPIEVAEAYERRKPPPDDRDILLKLGHPRRDQDIHALRAEAQGEIRRLRRLVAEGPDGGQP